MSDWVLHEGDCLDVLPTLAAGSVDAVICDPPYGTTNCKWDSVIPFVPMWEQLRRVAKPRAAIVLFGSQPFTSALVMSNPQMFRHQWVWHKRIAGNPMLAKVQPMKVHEDVCVFASESPCYYPQMRRGKMRVKGGGASNLWHIALTESRNDQYYPTSLLDYSNAVRGDHPTQKPQALFSYLVKTYSNAGGVVLDFTMGSGTTGAACLQNGRKFIGIEKDPDYFRIAHERLVRQQAQYSLLDAEGCIPKVGGPDADDSVSAGSQVRIL